MAESLSTVEALIRPSLGQDAPGLFRIRPVVVDTSALLPDVLWCARSGKPSRLLAALAHGSIRAFAGHHVWAEVPRHIDDRAPTQAADPALAKDIWFEEYVPRIRFVDTGGLALGAAQSFVDRDPTDLPTFALWQLLAPVAVWAGDRDLRDPGVAPDNWMELAAHANTIAVIGQGTYGTLLVGGAAAVSIYELGDLLVHFARTRVGQIVGGLGLLALLLTRERWLPRGQERVAALGQGARQVLGASVAAAASLFEEYQRADMSWTGAEGGEAPLALENEVARLLATAPAPVSRSAVARALRPRATESGVRRLTTELGPVLRGFHAFVQVSERRWQLGRAGVDFGIPAPESSRLNWGMPPVPEFVRRLGAGNHFGNQIGPTNRTSQYPAD